MPPRLFISVRIICAFAERYNTALTRGGSKLVLKCRCLLFANAVNYVNLLTIVIITLGANVTQPSNTNLHIKLFCTSLHII